MYGSWVRVPASSQTSFKQEVFLCPVHTFCIPRNSTNIMLALALILKEDCMNIILPFKIHLAWHTMGIKMYKRVSNFAGSETIRDEDQKNEVKKIYRRIDISRVEHPDFDREGPRVLPINRNSQFTKGIQQWIPFLIYGIYQYHLSARLDIPAAWDQFRFYWITI